MDQTASHPVLSVMGRWQGPRRPSCRHSGLDRLPGWLPTVSRIGVVRLCRSYLTLGSLSFLGDGGFHWGRALWLLRILRQVFIGRVPAVILHYCIFLYPSGGRCVTPLFPVRGLFFSFLFSLFLSVFSLFLFVAPSTPGSLLTPLLTLSKHLLCLVMLEC